MTRTRGASIAVIGGSGLYTLLEEPLSVRIETPYGAPSDAIAVGSFAGRQVAFLARHGGSHGIPPHRIPHRANLWALAAMGVRHVFATAAVGSLDPALRPDSFAVPDQLIDRTPRGGDTYFDGPDVQHLGFADPFDETVRSAFAVGLRRSGETLYRTDATIAVIPGPRFSTRAESRALRNAGADLVNMTMYPEAALAAELGLGYAGLAFVTDMDAGARGGAGDEAAVDADVVLRRLAAARPRLVAVLAESIRALPVDAEPEQRIARAAVDAVLARSPECVG